MKAHLRCSPHLVIDGEVVVEVFHEGRFIGTITGADGPGVRFLSKYVNDQTPVIVVQRAIVPPMPGMVEVIVDTTLTP